MPKVAIIFVGTAGGWDCDHDIAKTVTEWQEITDDEYSALTHYWSAIKCPRDTRAAILVQQPPDEFAYTVAAAVVHAKRAAEEAAKRKEKAQRARLKGLATKAEKERLKYEELKKQFEK